MPLKRAVTEFGKTYKDRFALRTYPGTSVPIFIFILGWSRTKPRVTLSAQTMGGLKEPRWPGKLSEEVPHFSWLFSQPFLSEETQSLQLNHSPLLTYRADLAPPKPSSSSLK